MVERLHIESPAWPDPDGELVRFSDYEALRAELEQAKRERDQWKKAASAAKAEAKASIGWPRSHTAQAAERLAGAQVKGVEAAREALGELANVKMDLALDEWCRISNTILSALAEPAGEAEPEGLRQWREDQLERVRNWSPPASAIREALEKLLTVAEKQKAYHNTKQHEFPSIEQCTDENGILNPSQNLYALLQGEAYNGRYTEADWWICTIREEIAALAGSAE